jgi:hypothetical protein
MNLISAVIAFVVLGFLSISSVIFVNQAAQSTAAQVRTKKYVQNEVDLRQVLRSTVSQALRVNLYSSPSAAQAGTGTPITSGGNSAALRLDYERGVQANNAATWSATIYLSGTDLVYRNQNGNQWTIASNVTGITWSTQDGLLQLAATVDGVTHTVWTAIN